MFPIRDHNPSGRTPWVTWALMFVNIAVFLGYWGEMDNVRFMNAFWVDWAMIPSRIASGDGGYTLFTSMFLHGGIMHLAGNMLFLYIFGDNIEDALGHVTFLCFYLICGVLASVTHVALAPGSGVPLVGASGAIAGVMGAYLLLFPKARVDILIVLIVFFKVFPIPAWIVLAVWFGMQFVGGVGSDAQTGGVAYWAHAGGFVAGILATFPVWLKKGGTGFWARTHGHPPHPEARYSLSSSRIPKMKRR